MGVGKTGRAIGDSGVPLARGTNAANAGLTQRGFCLEQRDGQSNCR
jgi:hypothetical protein